MIRLFCLYIVCHIYVLGVRKSRATTEEKLLFSLQLLLVLLVCDTSILSSLPLVCMLCFVIFIYIHLFIHEIICDVRYDILHDFMLSDVICLVCT